MSDRSRRATTIAKSAASVANQRAEEAKKAVRAQQRSDYNAVMEELGGPRRSIEEAMAPYVDPSAPARPGSERARYEAIMGKPYPGFEPRTDEDEAMGRGRRRRSTKKAGRRRKARKTRRRS